MPIAFKCSGCGQGYKVPDDAAGRTTKCRKCGTVNSVPSPSSFAAKPIAPAPASEPENDFSDFGAESPFVPKRKKKKSKALFFVLFGLAFAFFGCILLPAAGGLAFYFFYLSNDGMQYMPDNPQLVVSIRIRDSMQSELTKKMQKAMPAMQANESAKLETDLYEKTGLKFENVDKLMLGMGDSSSELVYVAFTNKVVDVPEFVKKISGQNKITELKVGKHTLYQHGGKFMEGAMPPIPMGNSSTSDKQCLCSPESKVYMFGPTKVVKAILERNGKPKLSDNMKRVMKAADLSATTCTAVDVDAIRSKFPAAKESLGQFAPDVTGAVLNISQKSDIKVDAVVLCKDEKSADELRKKTEGVVSLGKGTIVEKLGSEAAEFFDNLKFATSGSNMTVSLFIKGDSVVNLIEKNMKNLPMPQKPMDPVMPQ